MSIGSEEGVGEAEDCVCFLVCDPRRKDKIKGHDHDLAPGRYQAQLTGDMLRTGEG